MRRILITGGSHAEVPLIQALKTLDCYVISTGNNRDGIGHIYADKYIKGDFSDRDFVYYLARAEKVDGIVSGCNDFAYIATAYACEKLSLPGHDSYENAKMIHHKNEFMFACSNTGVAFPETYECMCIEDCLAAADKIQYPIIIKPIDLTGGKGVTVCYNNNDLKEAYEETIGLTREALVIIEKFVSGENHGASFLIKNKKVVFSFFDNEQYYLNKYLVSGACYPSNLSDSNKSLLVNEIEKLVSEYRLVDGLFHFQFIVDKNGMPIIIDPCRRAPGDLYVKLVKYATGVDYPMQIVKFEIGDETPTSYELVERNIARECIMTDGNGLYKRIVINESVMNNMREVFYIAKKNCLITDFLKFKAGIAFLEFDSTQEMYDAVRRFHKLVTIERG